MTSQAPPAPASSAHCRRITDDRRAQLDIVARLTGRTATEKIRIALEHWIAKTTADPELLKKAATVRADIEREA